ncbi:DUF6273 domain-containing protein [Carnobacterium maltaromaticum]|uniref:DUF6273 domain-containing protein n=1 Tax=Carnobacterium maltaromaticum TaxID=2751 RepID=UPI0012FB3988|nr:DUF6273 domain-containing protein [Carnobacterium maltaromaticum]
MKNNRKRSLLAIAFLAVLLFISGTFAWTSFSQRALNENDGEGGNPGGGRIHDDYNKLSGNKDIYGENYGDQELFVRIKLSEYFEMNGKPLVSGTTKDQRNSWTPYVLPETTAPTNDYRTYVNWTLGGDKVYLPTFNTNSSDLSTDAAGDAIDYITNGATALGDGSQDFFTKDQEVENPDDATQKHKAQSTLKQSKAPISMADWKALPANEKTGDFWVVDTDGWAYWGNKLQPNASTSLLLDQIGMDEAALSTIDGKWYYGIDVVGEFVTENDVAEFDKSEHGAPTEDGKDLLNEIVESDKFAYNIAFTTSVSNVQMKSNETKQFGATVTQTEVSKATIDTPLTWSIAGGSFASIDQTGKVTLGDVEKETKLTVTVKAAEYGLQSQFDITARPGLTAGVGEEFDFYGEKYIHLKDLGDGNHLVLRKFLLINRSTTLPDYNNSALDNTMREYYAGLTPEAQSAVQPVQKTFTVGMGNDIAFGLDAQRFLMSKPAPDFAKVDTIGGEKKAFALSVAEVSDVSGDGKAFPDAASRRSTYEATPDRHESWWSRTPSASGQIWAVSGNYSSSFPTGQFYRVNMGSYGLRPALIIHQ